MRRAVLLLIAGPLVLGACGGPATSASAPASAGGGNGMVVVATTTVLADLVRSVAGESVDVSSLVPKGGEVHTFDPAPSDMQRVAAATLIVGNGLGLDEWLTDLAARAGATAPVVHLGEDLDGVAYVAGDDGTGANPHLWLDVAIAQRYVARIAEALAAADPSGAAGYADRAAAYDARLAALDTSIRVRFEALPAANRRIVSFHDAFPYFAAAYGLEVVGVVVAAPGQDPSAGEVAALIEAIRASGARAILAEAQFNDRLARQIADETGVTVVADLYTDSLGDPPLDSYEAIIGRDADRILEALGG